MSLQTGTSVVPIARRPKRTRTGRAVHLRVSLGASGWPDRMLGEVQARGPRAANLGFAPGSLPCMEFSRQFRRVRPATSDHVLPGNRAREAIRLPARPVCAQSGVPASSRSGGHPGGKRLGGMPATAEPMSILGAFAACRLLPRVIQVQCAAVGRDPRGFRRTVYGGSEEAE